MAAIVPRSRSAGNRLEILNQQIGLIPCIETFIAQRR